MKALLISIGTRGDIEPFLAVGKIHGDRAGWLSVSIAKLSEAQFENRLLDLYDNDNYKRNAMLFAEQMATESSPDKLFQIIVGKGEKL